MQTEYICLFPLLSDENIVFTFDMDAGSDVTVSIDYGDRIIDTYNQPPSTEWAGPQTFDHEYHNGGLYPVVATFSNAAGKIWVPSLHRGSG